MQAVGLNNVGKLYTYGYGFINNEREEGFDWLANQVGKRREELGIPHPEVVITDKEAALKKALASVFPAAVQQLCIFHIDRNVQLQIHRKWNASATREMKQVTYPQPEGEQSQTERPQAQQPQPAQPQTQQTRLPNGRLDSQLLYEPVDPQMRDIRRRIVGRDTQVAKAPSNVEYSKYGLYELWTYMLYSDSEDDFVDAWNRMQSFFSAQNDILDYLKETYFSVAKQWAGCFISEILNFGQRTTSPVEAAYRHVKSFIRNGRCVVDIVVRQCERAAKAQEDTTKRARFEELNRTVTDYDSQEWMGDTRNVISRLGLKKVTEQYRIMLGILTVQRGDRPPRPLPPCTKKFTAQYGIPCSHELLERYP